MSANLGINLVEIDGIAPGIQAAPTSIAGFVVRSERGVPGVVRQISSFTQFSNYFGGYVGTGNTNSGTAVGVQNKYVGAYALQGFFDNGGTQAYVYRAVATEADAAAISSVTAAMPSSGILSLPGGLNAITLSAAFRGQPDPGGWSNSLAVLLYANPNVPPTSVVRDGGFDVVIARQVGTTYQILESWTKLAFGGANGARDPIATLNDPDSGSQYVMFVTTTPINVWAGSKAYGLGDLVSNINQATGVQNIYRATGIQGTSASTGAGPTQSSLTDGGVTWEWIVNESSISEWASGNAYGANAYVKVTAGSVVNVYQEIAPAPSTTSLVPPAGTGTGIPDGSIIWNWVFDESTAQSWNQQTNYSIGALVKTASGDYFRVSAITAMSGGNGPVGPGDSISDGTVTWSYAGPVIPAGWRPNSAYPVGTVVTTGINVYQATAPGTSAAGGAGPSGTAATISDGSVTWKWMRSLAYNNLSGGAEDSFGPDAGTYTPPLALDTLFANVFATSQSPFDQSPIQLLACPETATASVVQQALTYCSNRGDCMFVGHVPYTLQSQPGAKSYGQQPGLRADKVYGAIYAPYIKVADPIGSYIWIPPTGHILGVYARTDQQRGVWKAPAGNGASVAGALDVGFTLNDVDHTDLVKNGSVNMIRPINGAGILIDSSRTLSTNTIWLYVNVRRLFNFVKASLRDGLRWVVQEPNDAVLWKKINYTSITPFLNGLWRQGAFGSGSPSDLFTVDISDDNNPQSQVDQGILNITVTFYPSRPAETIIITVGQQEAAATTSES